MIEIARELDPEPHALLVWNGQEGDGPGGTRDFIAQLGYDGPGERVRIIDPAAAAVDHQVRRPPSVRSKSPWMK